MMVAACRRCGDSAISSVTASGAASGEIHTIECAGERLRLCETCYEEFRTWFYDAVPDTAPELESEPAGR